VLLTQLATAAGARVTAAARGGRKLELAAKLGADVVVDYSEPEWTDRVRRAFGEADLVLDGAGGELGRAALAVTADSGRFIGYGSAAGGFADAGFAAAVARGVRVISLFDITRGEADWPALAARAQHAAATGEIEVVVGQSFPLAAAARAHAAIEAREAIGRTLLLVK
jgi:NADPH2:quinone reductase